MIGEKRIEALLNAFRERGIEKPRPELGQAIKGHIPHRLSVHGLDTISIIVDLRISRLAAAAVILLVVFLAGSFFGGHEGMTGGVYENGKFFLKYALGGNEASRSRILEGLSIYRDNLLAEGKEVVYYGDRAKVNDPYSILMHWKQSEDRYGVIFGDFSARTVSAKTLIRLQAHMLKDQGR
jgi:hypothetical protein